MTATLRVGERIGAYEVIAKLGEGGMGEVFRARDTTLDREVALKVLPRVFAADVERRNRFTREARMLAALNHPNIGAIYGFEDAHGRPALVLELVEGPTLAERLADGPLSLNDGMAIGRQIAVALEAAHAKGIVHRDLKPANIKITPSNTVKVLDFGLAKMADHDASSAVAEAPTLLAPDATLAGAIVGTAAYMSPEQARGEPVDTRTDIWAFGCVLYEILTGRKAFAAGTTAATLAAVRDREPDWSAVPAATPRAVRRALRECLQKNRDARAADIGALRAVVDAALAPRLGVARAAWLALAAAAILLVLALLALRWNRQEAATVATADRRVQSLAILPLRDQSSDSAQAYFSDGMTEAIITRVAQVGSLSVVPRSSVAKYRDRTKTPSEIAQELAVDAVLEGSISRSGERVRITIHLIDPVANRELWADSFDRELGDVLALQDQVAIAVARRLQVALSPETAAAQTRSRRVNPSAYDAYLRGLAHLERVNREDTEAAITVLERATALDPTFADAFGALAAAQTQLYGSYAPGEAARLEPLARAAIEKAYALDPHSADAHAAEGNLLWSAAHGWPHEEAARAYREAIRLKPNFDRARRALSIIYNHVGLADAARNELVRSDDSAAALSQRGLALQIDGAHEQALAVWSAIPTLSRNTLHIGHLAWVLSDLGRTKEAWSLLDEAAAQQSDDVSGTLAGARALLHALARDRRQSERWMAAATARAESTTESHHATFLVALAYAQLGNREEALRWLRFTAANGFPCYPLFARDRNLDPIRSFAPFNEFLQELKVRWEDRQRRLVN